MIYVKIWCLFIGGGLIIITNNNDTNTCTTTTANTADLVRLVHLVINIIIITQNIKYKIQNTK